LRGIFRDKLVEMAEKEGFDFPVTDERREAFVSNTGLLGFLLLFERLITSL